jgi:DNA-binding PucR family transcriptional regulator
MKIASQKLGLHVNTVRYRINKAQEIGRFSLDDPDDRLLAELQVRLVT